MGTLPPNPQLSWQVRKKSPSSSPTIKRHGIANRSQRPLMFANQHAATLNARLDTQQATNANQAQLAMALSEQMRKMQLSSEFDNSPDLSDLASKNVGNYTTTRPALESAMFDFSAMKTQSQSTITAASTPPSSEQSLPCEEVVPRLTRNIKELRLEPRVYSPPPLNDAVTLVDDADDEKSPDFTPSKHRKLTATPHHFLEKYFVPGNMTKAETYAMALRSSLNKKSSQKKSEPVFCFETALPLGHNYGRQPLRPSHPLQLSPPTASVQSLRPATSVPVSSLGCQSSGVDSVMLGVDEGARMEAPIPTLRTVSAPLMPIPSPQLPQRSPSVPVSEIDSLQATVTPTDIFKFYSGTGKLPLGPMGDEEIEDWHLPIMETVVKQARHDGELPTPTQNAFSTQMPVETPMEVEGQEQAQDASVWSPQERETLIRDYRWLCLLRHARGNPSEPASSRYLRLRSFVDAQARGENVAEMMLASDKVPMYRNSTASAGQEAHMVGEHETGQVHDLANATNDLRSAFAQASDRLERQLNALDGNLGQFEGNLGALTDSLDDNIGSLGDHIGTLESKMHTLGGTIDRAGHQFRSHVGTITGLGHLLNTAHASHMIQQGHFDARLERLDKTIEKMEILHESFLQQRASQDNLSQYQTNNIYNSPLPSAGLVDGAAFMAMETILQSPIQRDEAMKDKTERGNGVRERMGKFWRKRKRS